MKARTLPPLWTPLPLIYLLRVFGCCVALAVGGFPKGDPFPALIEGNHRLHRFIWDQTETRRLYSVFTCQIKVVCRDVPWNQSYMSCLGHKSSGGGGGVHTADTEQLIKYWSNACALVCHRGVTGKCFHWRNSGAGILSCFHGNMKTDGHLLPGCWWWRLPAGRSR